jgi:hypothetical protein
MPCRYQCSLPVKLLNSAAVSFPLSSLMGFPFRWLWVAAAAATLASPRPGVARARAAAGEGDHPPVRAARRAGLHGAQRRKTGDTPAAGGL